MLTFVLSVLVVALTVDRFLHRAKTGGIETRVDNIESSLRHGVTFSINSLTDRLNKIEANARIAGDDAEKIVQKITGKTSSEVLAAETTPAAAGGTDQPTN